jgi:hypothetical protein
VEEIFGARIPDAEKFFLTFILYGLLYFLGIPVECGSPTAPFAFSAPASKQ